MGAQEPCGDAVITAEIERMTQGLGTVGSMRWQLVHVGVAVDVSLSMKDRDKFKEAFAAFAGLLSQVAADRYAERFRFARVEFTTSALVTQRFGLASDLLRNLKPSRPRGSTSIGSALEELYDLLLPVRPTDPLAPGNVGFIFSDGDETEWTPDPVAAGEKVKSVSTLVTVCFGKHANRELMRNIASPQCCYDVGEGNLVQFLKRFGRTLTYTVNRGGHSAKTMTQIQ